MEIRDVDRSDENELRQFWQVGKDTEAAYRPYDFTSPWEAVRTLYVEGRPGFEHVLLAAFEDGRIVARCQIALPLLDNTHLCFADIHVLPGHQRRGLGRALVERAEAVARERGRRSLVSEAYVPIDADGPALAFARATGFTEALEDGIKIVDLVETEPSWDQLEKEADERRNGYTLVPWTDTVPDEHLAGFCHLNEAFNDEAPSGELELEREVWDEDRVRRGEAQGRKAGRRVFAVAALAPDGTMVGLTEAMVNVHAAHRGFQSGTLVLPEHRGHALGLAMKVANHRAIRAAYPECRVLMTGNADVNAAMNAVNDRLGYRAVERCVEVKKDL